VERGRLLLHLLQVVCDLCGGEHPEHAVLAHHSNLDVVA
jgi:hypothetical protein